MKTTRTLTLMLMLTCAACAYDQPTSQTAYATSDSFAKPTEHGELTFGANHAASVTDEQRFHSWTFTLADDALVALSAEPRSGNIDPVMYLYRKGESGWGQYIAKNDDHQGGPESFITEELPAGEYRIKVKGNKDWQRGELVIGGACDGAGCPSEELCAGAGSTEWKQPTGYNPSCDATLATIFVTPRAPLASHCQDAMVARVRTLYEAFWNDNYGYSYEEVAGGYEPTIEIEHYPGAGTLATAEVGDETQVDFIFDADGELIHYTLQNQSPDYGWYCDGGPVGDEPNEDCVGDMFYSADYDSTHVHLEDGTHEKGELDGDTPWQVMRALERYDVPDGTIVAYDLRQWINGYAEGALVHLSDVAALDAGVEMTIAGPSDWPWIVSVFDGSEVRVICDHP